MKRPAQKIDRGLGKGYNTMEVGNHNLLPPLRRTMKDDEKYQRVMGAYKLARRDPKKRKEAQQLLAEAFRLEREGEVSPEVVEGMAYL